MFDYNLLNGEKEKALYRLLIEYKMRPSEVLALTSDDIHGRTILVTNALLGTELVCAKEIRTITIDFDLPKADGRIFDMDLTTLKHHFKEVAQKAGLQTTSIYALRHGDLNASIQRRKNR